MPRSGEVFGSFKVKPHAPDLLFLPMEWMTGPQKGKVGNMHRGSVALCPVVER